MINDLITIFCSFQLSDGQLLLKHNVNGYGIAYAVDRRLQELIRQAYFS